MAQPNLADIVRVELGVAGSQDRLPFIVVDGAGANNAIILTAADEAHDDFTFEIAVRAVDGAFDIAIVGHAVTVTLAYATGAVTPISANNLITQLNDNGTWPGISAIFSAALFTRDAQNVGVTNTGAGTYATAQALQSASNESLTGAGVSHAGYNEAVVILALGDFEPLAELSVKLQHADTVDGTYADISGADFGSLDYSDAQSVKTGHLLFNTKSIKKYLRVVSAVTGDWVEHTCVFVMGGGQYLNDGDSSVHTFTI